MAFIRKASTLILAAPVFVANTSNHVKNEIVKILSLKRSSDSNHYPNAYVFPGGNRDAADCSNDWFSILPPESYKYLSDLNLVDVLPLNHDAEMNEAISTRITAIRETFEESGLLFCQRTSYKFEKHPKLKHLIIDNSCDWRNKIRNDPTEFLNLCRFHKCYPTIQGLFLINRWITPAKIKRRYDCNFFIAIMDELVEGTPDNLEVKSVEWHEIKHYLNSDMFLPNPQFYELSNLEKFNNTNSIFEFVRGIDSSSCIPMLPVMIRANNGMIFLYPGDERYDEAQHYDKDEDEFNVSINALRSKVMHRIEISYDKKVNLVIKNYTLPQYKSFNYSKL